MQGTPCPADSCQPVSGTLSRNGLEGRRSKTGLPIWVGLAISACLHLLVIWLVPSFNTLHPLEQPEHIEPIQVVALIEVFPEPPRLESTKTVQRLQPQQQAKVSPKVSPKPPVKLAPEPPPKPLPKPIQEVTAPALEVPQIAPEVSEIEEIEEIEEMGPLTAKIVEEVEELIFSEEGLELPLTSVPEPVAEPSSAKELFSPPVLLSQTQPVYPLRARQRGWTGEVSLWVQVSPTGEAAEVEVKQSSGYAILDAAALEAVQSWLFTPAQQGEEPVVGELPIVVRFTLE